MKTRIPKRRFGWDSNTKLYLPLPGFMSNSGGTGGLPQVQDWSDSKNHGDVTGAVMAPDGIGLLHDGIDDFTTFPHQASQNVGGATKATWSLWTNLTAGVDSGLFGKGSPFLSSDLRYFLRWDYTNFLVRFGTLIGSAWHTVASNVVSIPGSWHVIDITWDLTNINFFVDAVAQGSSAFSASYFPTTTVDLTLGRFQKTTASEIYMYTNGTLDNFRIRAEDLTLLQIQNKFETERRKYGV